MRAWARHYRDLWKGRLRAARGQNLKHEALRLPPRRDGRRQGIAIAAIVKDEAPYLAEWIEFHAMQGVSAIYIYDNGSTDATVPLLENTAWQVPVRCIPWASFDGLSFTQRFAYAHALTNFGPDHRWMAFIDVDEFLFPLIDPDLPTAMGRFGNQPAVCLPWFNFGTSGHRTPPAGLVIENYRERAPFPPPPEGASLLRFKSIVDPAAVVLSGSHAFGFDDSGHRLYNEVGDKAEPGAMRRPGFARSDILRLNHYFTRSEAELAKKLAKGRVSRNGTVHQNAYDRRLAQYARSVEPDETILRHVPALKARLANLKVAHDS